jgi:hypothetical protein
MYVPGWTASHRDQPSPNSPVAAPAGNSCRVLALPLTAFALADFANSFAAGPDGAESGVEPASTGVVVVVGDVRVRVDRRAWRSWTGARSRDAGARSGDAIASAEAGAANCDVGGGPAGAVRNSAERPASGSAVASSKAGIP